MFGAPTPPAPPTSKATVATDGTARLYRFHAEQEAAPGRLPLVLVPSLINRWYVLDLRPGASLVEALVGRGFDVWCLDWGVPEAEDRYLCWDDLLARLSRVLRIVRRTTGVERAGLLGYCMGGTLCGIHAGLEPDTIAALVNLAGPFDFSEAGVLAELTRPAFFDVDAMVEAGNIVPAQMQSGFTSMRPTAQLAKWVGWLDRAHDPAARESFNALEAWASDNIPFPAEAYRTYIRDLYQENLLVQGRHHARGRRVDLAAIRCPILTIVAERDAICPPPAATALNDRASAARKDVLRVPGGHVGAVVGRRASKVLYPAMAEWLGRELAVA